MSCTEDISLDGSTLRRIRLLAIGLFGFLALYGLVVDLRNVSAGGSIDLRNRVVGARLLAAQKNPYFYQWQA
jgi:hypothetical protein